MFTKKKNAIFLLKLNKTNLNTNAYIFNNLYKKIVLSCSTNEKIFCEKHKSKAKIHFLLGHELFIRSQNKKIYNIKPEKKYRYIGHIKNFFDGFYFLNNKK